MLNYGTQDGKKMTPAVWIGSHIAGGKEWECR